MTTNVTAIPKDLNTLIGDLAETLAYIGVVDGPFNPVGQKMAVDVVQWVYRDMHNRYSANLYPHHAKYECRTELIRRCEALTYRQIETLVTVVTHTYTQTLSNHTLELH